MNETFNIQLKNLSSDDSGWYDMSFTVFGAGTIRSALDNSSFLLDVNGLYMYIAVNRIAWGGMGLPVLSV